MVFLDHHLNDGYRWYSDTGFVDFPKSKKPVLIKRKAKPILTAENGAYDKSLKIYYDTTFNIGNYYLSIFSYRYYVLDGDPVIPAAFLIHQRKFAVDHNSFLLKLIKKCPNLASKPFAFITDREFTNISSIFPKACAFILL